MTAPLHITTTHRLQTGFTSTPASRCWITRCRACATSPGAVVARSAAMDRPGWHACMAAARAHIAKHKEGGRL